MTYSTLGLLASARSSIVSTRRCTGVRLSTSPLCPRRTIFATAGCPRSSRPAQDVASPRPGCSPLPLRPGDHRDARHFLGLGPCRAFPGVLRIADRGRRRDGRRLWTLLRAHSGVVARERGRVGMGAVNAFGALGGFAGAYVVGLLGGGTQSGRGCDRRRMGNGCARGDGPATGGRVRRRTLGRGRRPRRTPREHHYGALSTRTAPRRTCRPDRRVGMDAGATRPCPSLV